MTHHLKFRGRPPVHLAESVKSVVNFDNPYAKAIIDRATPMTDEFIGAVLAQSLFGWEDRNPRPALDADGNFQGTDLDLLSFLVPMAKRQAVIEIPRYRNRRKIVIKANERKIGSNQFGNLRRLVSNKEVFSFSVGIFDRTIAVTDAESNTEDLGAHRNYMVVDCDGFWYDGWNQIVWNPTAAENRFLSENGLWTGNAVYFTHYVHPNRWQSVFGAPYLLLKMLIERLNDEAGFYRKEMKRLEQAGVCLPNGEKKPYVPAVAEGGVKKITVETLEAELDIPKFSDAYAPAANNQAGLMEAYQRQKFLTYTLRPQVQFVARADEAAYFRYGNSRVASWMGSRTWKSGYKISGKRIAWNQMVLASDFAIRYRVKEVSQQVSAE